MMTVAEKIISLKQSDFFSSMIYADEHRSMLDNLMTFLEGGHVPEPDMNTCMVYYKGVHNFTYDGNTLIPPRETRTIRCIRTMDLLRIKNISSWDEIIQRSMAEAKLDYKKELNETTIGIKKVDGSLVIMPVTKDADTLQLLDKAHELPYILFTLQELSLYQLKQLNKCFRSPLPFVSWNDSTFEVLAMRSFECQSPLEISNVLSSMILNSEEHSSSRQIYEIESSSRFYYDEPEYMEAADIERGKLTCDLLDRMKLYQALVACRDEIRATL